MHISNVYDWSTGEKVPNLINSDMNSKIKIDPYANSSDNRILVYKFVTDDGITHESYHDDYEHGAESRYLRHMRETHIQNTAFVITR